MIFEIFAVLGRELLSSFSAISNTSFVSELIKSTIALFVVIDPIGSVPLFIALTEKMGKEERKTVSKVAIITAAALLVVFAVAAYTDTCYFRNYCFRALWLQVGCYYLSYQLN